MAKKQKIFLWIWEIDRDNKRCLPLSFIHAIQTFERQW